MRRPHNGSILRRARCPSHVINDVGMMIRLTHRPRSSFTAFRATLSGKPVPGPATVASHVYITRGGCTPIGALGCGNATGTPGSNSSGVWATMSLAQGSLNKISYTGWVSLTGGRESGSPGGHGGWPDGHPRQRACTILALPLLNPSSIALIHSHWRDQDSSLPTCQKGTKVPPNLMLLTS